MDQQMLIGNAKDVEYQASVSDDSMEYMKTVIAFSNSGGGRIVFGVSADGKEAVGIPRESVFEKMDTIAKVIKESSEPVITPNMMIQSVDGKAVILMDIPGGVKGPFFLKNENALLGTYIREDHVTKAADIEMLKQLIIGGKEIAFDQRKLPDVVLQDDEMQRLCDQMQDVALRRAITPEQKRAVKPITKETLNDWGVIVEEDGKTYATNAYALLTNQCNLPPVIQCAVFKTENRSVFLDRREIRGTVQSQMEQAFQYVLEKINMGATFDGAYREDVYELPPDSLRELIANAIVHRSYTEAESIQIAIFQDRVEITSPGALLRGVTINKMKQGCSKLRNRSLAQAFAYMNLIEKWGSGIPRILQECRAYGLQEPEIIDFNGDVRINIYRQNVHAPEAVKQERPAATVQPREEAPKAAPEPPKAAPAMPEQPVSSAQAAPAAPVVPEQPQMPEPQRAPEPSAEEPVHSLHDRYGNPIMPQHEQEPEAQPRRDIPSYQRSPIQQQHGTGLRPFPSQLSGQDDDNRWNPSTPSRMGSSDGKKRILQPSRK